MMKPTLNDKLIAYLALISGLSISCIAEYYSIMGLIAIYPAMLLPVVIMGGVIGLGKISGLIWLKQNWEWSPRFIKAYLVPCIAVMMFITSVGCFGFLSKAHSDQTLVSGDVQAKIAIYDEKIKVEKENIDANRKILGQLDAAVDQVMARSEDEKGADKAVAIRKAQQKDRSRLSQEITESQKRIASLNEERAPVAAEVRKVDAEVGPIKYIAAFIYGGNPDSNLLEKAVGWVSVLIVIVLDPMALVMLLASQYSFQHIRQMEEQEDSPTIPEIDSHVGEKPVAEEAVESLEAKRILEKGVTNFDPNHNMSLEEDMDIGPAPIEVTTTSTATIQYQFLEDINDEIPYNTPTEDFLVENPPTVTDTGPLGRAEWVERPVDNGPDFEGVRDVNTKKWIQTGPNFEPESWKDKEYVIVDGQQMHISAARTMMKSKQSQGYVQNEEQGESTKWNRVISEAEYRDKINDNKNNTNNAS
jgi:hypothetical protein